MKVLFVTGGNTDKFGVPPLIVAQGDSLIKDQTTCINSC